MGRRFHHLSFDEREMIGLYHAQGYSPYWIGKTLKRSSNTIRNELKRGTVVQIKKEREVYLYFASTGQLVYERNRKRCKAEKKLKTCQSFLQFIDHQVLEQKYSLEVARAKAIRLGSFSMKEIISTSTLYKYVSDGLLKIKNIDLIEKVRRKEKRNHPTRKHKRLKGVSIAQRNDSVLERKEFGHWEIDLVIGSKQSDQVLLTMVERMSRFVYLCKLPSKESKYVLQALTTLYQKYSFAKEVFKSITCDNGTEFSKLYTFKEKLGIDVFYAHPFSSWERGSNENLNRMVRRFIKKGRKIRNYTKSYISQVQTWINELPRKKLGWLSAKEIFQEQLALINSFYIESMA